MISKFLGKEALNIFILLEMSSIMKWENNMDYRKAEVLYFSDDCLKGF
jgi:hypothetical protein